MRAYKCKIEEESYPCTNLSAYRIYEDNLFVIFAELYIDGNLYFRGKPIKMKEFPPEYGEESGFYHLICENYDQTEGEQARKPSLQRCERIRWPHYVISNCVKNDCDDFLVWPNTRKGKKCIVLYCIQFEYVVILGIRNGYYLLTTAYPVDREHTRNKLLKEYRKYKQTTSAT